MLSCFHVKIKPHPAFFLFGTDRDCRSYGLICGLRGFWVAITQHPPTTLMQALHPIHMVFGSQYRCTGPGRGMSGILLTRLAMWLSIPTNIANADQGHTLPKHSPPPQNTPTNQSISLVSEVHLQPLQPCESDILFLFVRLLIFSFSLLGLPMSVHIFLFLFSFSGLIILNLEHHYIYILFLLVIGN